MLCKYDKNMIVNDFWIYNKIIVTYSSYTLSMPTFLTPGRHGYSVRFSRTRPDALAVATSQYYGLAGGGTLFFLEIAPDGSTIIELQKLEWTDGLFDVVSSFFS